MPLEKGRDVFYIEKLLKVQSLLCDAFNHISSGLKIIEY